MTEPFISDLMPIEPGWIDHNGHLNMAYYGVLFDRGVDKAWDWFGMGLEYVATSGFTTFSAEAHIRYLREVKLGDRVRSTFQILDHDPKRIHSFQEMIHEDGWVAATCENLHLSIDQSGPKVAPFPQSVFARIEEMAGEHVALPRPAGAGRPIGIRRKTA